ncbi:hypothetical protein N5D16_00165 [Acinetobacter johnsonii]|uniref:hypothetical protein n=1 Tax=Acinetobacter johnsonii TaxID=40214 RepID=UPI00244A528D|nr:hypothetical protein [Acinetobacter johnsonii]MDH1362887.1 hypothetical protein [Acinetobacter johnsonii]
MENYKSFVSYQTGKCPSQTELNLLSTIFSSKQHIQSINTSSAIENICILSLTLKNSDISSKLQNKNLDFTLTSEVSDNDAAN